MEEKNKKNLDDAIRNLPEYEPQFNLWDKIDEGLNQSDAAIVLHEAIADLPTYNPPDVVWENIEKQLPSTSKVRRLRWIQAAAACIAFVVAFGLIQMGQKQVPEIADATISISYSEEVVTLAETKKTNFADDKDYFSIVTKACLQKLAVCSLPEFKQLRVELNDLDFAKRKLEKNISPYDTDPTHQIQLTEIEQERADILKKLVAMI